MADPENCQHPLAEADRISSIRAIFGTDTDQMLRGADALKVIIRERPELSVVLEPTARRLKDAAKPGFDHSSPTEQ